MTKLIALAVIAAGALAADSLEVASGAAFEVSPEVAEPLLTQGLAKLADEPLAPAAKAKTVKVRVLTNCDLGKANDVVSLPAAEAKQAEQSGMADTAKEAVAYAMTLAQNQA